MATASRSGRMSEIHVTRALRSEISPERNKAKPDRRVPVVYYLSRNGQLEHPHFMEVPLSSSQGLFLRDVFCRLDVLRGKGLAALYSWSCKRSYKNGFVWRDLSEEDLIFPAHGQEYVLKGSLLPQPPPEMQIAAVDLDYSRRRRNQSCSSIDFSVEEYSVYKTESSSRSAAAADASTQTDDGRRRRRRPEIVSEKIKELPPPPPPRDEIEISPPPSDSSPETLEKLMKADGRLVRRLETADDSKIPPPAPPTGKSSVLMQLITCGSISFKDCGAGQGLISQYRIRAPRGVGGGTAAKIEEKEYFSGSLVETTKEEFPSLKRSNSYSENR